MVDDVYILIETTPPDEVKIVVEDSAEEVNLKIEDGVGPRGYSAYQIAVFNGFVGTEQDWLESLQSDIYKSPTAPENPYPNQLWAKINQ